MERVYENTDMLAKYLKEISEEDREEVFILLLYICIVNS